MVDVDGIVRTGCAESLRERRAGCEQRDTDQQSALSPHLFGDFDHPPQLGPLLVLSQNIAFFELAKPHCGLRHN